MYKTQITDADWRYRQLAEQLAAAQRTAETLSRALPAPAPAEKQRRSWWTWRRRNGYV